MNKLYFETYAELAPDIVIAQFPLVSYREKSLPSGGSPCRESKGINFAAMLDHALRIIEHGNGSMTVVTTIGWLRFWPVSP